MIRPGDNADNLIIVVQGVIEVYTEFEGNKFALEHLGAGSIINYRSFFMGDLMHVFMECTTNVIAFIVTHDVITKLESYHPKFKKSFDMFQHELLKTG